jgi:hypothetical protein
VTAPYETQREASNAVRHIIDSPADSWRDGTHRLLEDACRSAGIQLGAYDDQILLWLAGWEPWVCAVVAGLIIRAHAAGLADARTPAHAAATTAAIAAVERLQGRQAVQR